MAVYPNSPQPHKNANLWSFNEPQSKLPKRQPGLHVRMERALSSEVMSDFDSLVEQHRPRIFRFILASLRNRESAENLTQECFVKAFKAREQFRGAASIPTWLLQIAANLVRDHESSGRLKFWRRALKVDLTDVMDVIPDRQLSPESMLSVKQEVESIWRVAAKLPERQRTVLLLRFVEDTRSSRNRRSDRTKARNGENSSVPGIGSSPRRS